MWNVSVITDRKIPANRPDIYCMIKKVKTCVLIDTDRKDDSNFNTKKTEKISKYKDLEIEFSRM